ncbi:hypothetical protein ARMGADRAFT_1029142 [Armillaria gallica]|uniref:Uncharacterized protein n=1 Tax=Armillaria gallica TaxID=47427 RepID=A0A2H3DHT8_ARMGA|nr:hypothetical protein ARMGADRAFT_1029142 [Armillaria gallica]
MSNSMDEHQTTTSSEQIKLNNYLPTVHNPETSNDQQQGNHSSEQTEPYVSAVPSLPQSFSNVWHSGTLSLTVLDMQMASSTTALTQDPESSDIQWVTFTGLGSQVTVIGYMDGESTLLKVEVVLSRGNLSISVEYDFGEHVSLVLKLTILENRTFIYRLEQHSKLSIILFTEAKNLKNILFKVLETFVEIYISSMQMTEWLDAIKILMNIRVALG